MKRYVGITLVAINTALAAGLVWLWFKPSGELKNVHWSEPRGQKANMDDLVPRLGKTRTMDQSQFLAMLDRPLFSISRRPPPPPPPPPVQAPPPPPDYLSGAVLTGVYMSQDGKGGVVIIKFQGKDKSLPVKGVLDGWTLNSVAENRVYFTRGGETKEITLQKAKLETGPMSDAKPQAAPNGGDSRGEMPSATPRRRTSSIGGGANLPR